MSSTSLWSREQPQHTGVIEPCLFPPTLDSLRVTEPRTQYIKITTLPSALNPDGSIGQREFALLQNSWTRLISTYCSADAISFAWVNRSPLESVTSSLALDDLVAISVLSNCQASASQQPKYTRSIVRNVLSGKIKTLIDYTGRLDFITNGFEAGIRVVNQSDNLIALYFLYDQSRLSQAFSECLMARYRDMLAGESPEAWDVANIDDLSWIRSVNLVPLMSSNEACVHDMIRQQIRSRWHEIAIQAWDGQYSYAALDMHSNNLAGHMQSLGVRPHTWVPVILERTALLPVVLLAILKIGAAFIPLAPGSPSSRLQGILEDSSTKLFVCSSEQASSLVALDINSLIISHDLLEDLTARRPSIAVIPVISPTSPMMCLYTSGSTGRPKGVVILHEAFSTEIIGSLDSLGHEHWRVMQSASLAFDASIWQIFAPLMLGGCVCLPHDNECTADVAAAINRYRVDTILCVPSYAALFKPEDTPTLRRMLVGGELVSDEIIQRWSHVLRLITAYGPAESCVMATARVVETIHDKGSQIGRPFATHRAVIVSPSDPTQLVPVGVVGELVLAGPCLAQGYLNNEKQTLLSFIDKPRWTETFEHPETRYYRTGDLVKYDVCAMDGSLIYMGRKDDQVKLRGQRIELGEIEHHMKMMSDVGAVVVLVPRSGPFAEQLVAIIQEGPLRYTVSEIVQLVNNTSWTRSRLQDQLSSHLPGYMIPTHVFQVQNMPTTMSQKIDRRRIRSMIEDSALVCRELPVGDLLHQHEVVALSISEQLTKRCYRQGQTFQSAIQGRNVVLSSVGLTSIDLISISAFTQKSHGVRLPKALLFDTSVDIRQIARSIQAPTSNSTSSQKFSLLDDVQMLRQSSSDAAPASKLRSQEASKVLLTGATGYLGIELLRVLLSEYGYSVVTLVRGASEHEAKQRIIKSARQAGWWQCQYDHQLEVWLGDLSEPKLGLNQYHQAQLCGSTASIDLIVHNGAIVNYQYDYSKVKAANVLSTVSLLRIVENNRRERQQHLIYVSGGLQPSSVDDDTHNIAQIEASGSGYSQSKLVSELLIKEYASSVADNVYPRLTIVRPGYIVGTADSRVKPQTTDFLWRFLAGCISLQAVCEEHLNDWVFIADVTEVARTVLQPLSLRNTPCVGSNLNRTNVLRGIRWKDLLDLLQAEFGFILNIIPRSLWLKKLKNALDEEGEDHPLFAFQDGLDDSFQPFSDLAPCDQQLKDEMIEENAEMIIANVTALIASGMIKQ